MFPSLYGVQKKCWAMTCHKSEKYFSFLVGAEKFATMTTEEMASEEMKKTREMFTKEGILEHQMSIQEGF